MADIKGTPGGLIHKRDQMYRDEGDGTHAEDRSVLLRAWNAVSLAYQRLTVSNANGGLGVHILGSDVSSSGGTSVADGGAFAAGTTAGTPLMGARDDAASGTVAEDKLGIARITTNRAVHVNLRDAAGAEVSVGGGTQYDEDTAHVSGDKATMAGVVQQSADAAISGDGDRSLLQVDSSGFLKVNVKTGGAGGTQYTEDAAAAADPVGTALNLIRADSPAAVTTTDGDNVAARGTNKGEQYVKHIDSIPVTDNGGSLTVDNPALSVVGGGTEATAVRVTVATDSTGVLSVDDNGGSLTVDGSVTANAGTNLNTSALALETGGNLAGAATSLALLDDTIFADDAAFTVGTSKVSGAGFLADESSTDSVDEGDIGAARMTLDRKLIVTDEPHSAGGCDIFRSLDLDETEEEVKASAGTVYNLWFTNTATTTRWLKFYNATAANVTVGSTTPVLTIGLPGNTTDDVSGVFGGSKGFKFDTAITVAATTGVADADTGAPAANDVIVNLGYK